MPELTLGRDKTPISQLEDRDLTYWAKRIAEDLEKNPNSQYAENNRRKLEAVRDEQKRRANGGQQRQPSAPSGGGQRPSQDAAKAIELYSGAHDDAKKATEALAKIQEIGHLISPAPACATLPEGCAILLSAITVDSRNETYNVPGGKGLSKTALQKLAAALGVSWNHNASGRLDDGRDPYYFEFLAVGRVRNFDGTWREIEGRKVMDLRNGSPTIQALQNRAEQKAEREREKNPDAKVGDWESQLRDLRYFIGENAETKAQLRAIRSLGLRTSYSDDELRKPFFAAQIQFTGRSEDPEVRRMFAERIAESFMGQAVPALYGRQETQRRQPPRHAAPPVGLEDDDPIDTVGEPVDDPHGPDGVPVDDEYPDRDPTNQDEF